MLAKTYSYGIQGLEAFLVTIEVDVSRGLPCLTIVGLPDTAIKESKERVRSAIRNSGFKLKPQRVTVNLSPADVKKEGPCFDLAIAIGMLAASGHILLANLDKFALLGELSLDSDIKPVRGSLSVALSMRNSSFEGLILPFNNLAEAAIVENPPIYPVKTLNDVVHLLSNPGDIKPANAGLPKKTEIKPYDVDFAEVKGQNHVKRGLEIAASGMHNVLLIGPPGSGKSMLAKRFPTILPDMNFDEVLEISKIHSVLGYLKPTEGLMHNRPFRSPHHTTSDVALVGGGTYPKPGEITLSHHGVLFLDELPEFNRNVLEALRQPLEDHCVTIARANKTLQFPARTVLLAAMNPCPCGWFSDTKRECHCNPLQIQRYLSKISGPLLDRIDLHLEVPSLPSQELLSTTTAENSQTIKERTTQAWGIQKERFKNTAILSNAHMNHRQIKQYCALNTESKKLLKLAIEELQLSARAYDKILKVSRTIADLVGSIPIETEHLAEAIQYRSLDRNWFK